MTIIDDLTVHDALVMRIGNALEGVECDRAAASMLEVIAISLIESAAGDANRISQLQKLAERTLDNFIGFHLATYDDLKARGIR